MVKVVFFDIDGTLVSHTVHGIPESTKAAMHKLHEKGIQCVIATGRHVSELDEFMTEDMPFDGCVTLNGQMCFDQNKNLIYGEELSGAEKTLILEWFQAKEKPIALAGVDGWYINFVDETVERVQEAVSSLCPEVIEYQGDAVYQAVAYDTKDDDDTYRRWLPNCKISRWNPYAVDMNSALGSKMIGIQKFLEHIGVSQEETMAFGDGENDVEMLQFVQIGVAMGNAEPEVKAVADYVTTGVDEDGIPNALKHFGLI